MGMYEWLAWKTQILHAYQSNGRVSHNIGAPPFFSVPIARKVLGCPNICKLAPAFLLKYGYKRQKLTQLLGQLAVFLTQ